jgi:hypothetical protein
MARDRQLIGMLAGIAKRRGGAHRGKFLPRPIFDVEHEVKKDSFFVSAGIDIFFKNNVHNNFPAI